MQLAPASPSQPIGHNSHVPNMEYAYDVVHRTGLVTATLKVASITGTPIKGARMGVSVVCPIDTGACVSSATGGIVTGTDMYGQPVRETVGIAGTSEIAFAAIQSAPADAQWANQFGLPYKYLDDATPPATNITITAPASDGDARGTFVVVSPALTSVYQDIQLNYVADKLNLMGDAYASRWASDPVGSLTVSVTATLDPTGEAVVTIPEAGTPASAVTVTFPDGHTVRGTSGTEITHQLSPIWMSQYAKAIGTDEDALNKLIAVGFDNTAYEGVYATVTGGVTELMMMPQGGGGESLLQQAADVRTPYTALPDKPDPFAPAPVEQDQVQVEGAPGNVLRVPDVGEDTVEREEVEEPREPAPAMEEQAPVAPPWQAMTTHAAIDTWANDPSNGMELPDNWNTLTIAGKKNWLTENSTSAT